MRKIFYILSLLVVLTVSTTARAETVSHAGHQMSQGQESTMPASSSMDGNMSMMDMGKDMGSCCCKNMCSYGKTESGKTSSKMCEGMSGCGCCKGMKGKCKMPERQQRKTFQFNN